MEKALKKKYKRSENLSGFIFILPALMGLIAFHLLPVLFSVGISFAEWNFLTGFKGIKFAGIDNYLALLKDDWFLTSMKNSFILAITTVVIGQSLSLIIAYWINEYAYGKTVLKVILFIPYISSIVASAIVWGLVFHPSYGPVNEFLRSIGFESVPKWFMDVSWSLPTIIAFTIWLGMGYTSVVYMAGLKNIPRTVYEAAEIDGANGFSKFFHITIPLVSPTTFFLMILGIISSFKTFDQIMILTNGGPGYKTSNIAVYIYKVAFEEYRMGAASASALVMFAIIFLITVFQWKFQDKVVTY